MAEAKDMSDIQGLQRISDVPRIGSLDTSGAPTGVFQSVQRHSKLTDQTAKALRVTVNYLATICTSDDWPGRPASIESSRTADTSHTVEAQTSS